MKIIYNLAFLLLFQFLSCNHASESPLAKSDKAADANMVFRSADGGETWQNISEGLPEPVTDKKNVSRNIFFANDHGLYLSAGNGIYHSKPNATAPFWIKEISPDERSSIAPGKPGI